MSHCSRGCVVAAVAIAVALTCAARGADPSEAKDMSDPPFAHRVKMQPFPEQLAWINTARPVDLGELRGKFVLLDFWTYCCINCMHILPELKKLEKAYPAELVVVGVHSAKFDAEKDSDNIREAVRRYKIEHPVVNDPESIVWRRLGVRSWPTLVLIDPEGYAVWGNSGEATFDQLDALMKRAIPYYRKKGLLDPKPLDLTTPAADETALRYPGKVLADEAGGRLFVADSNHNRIVVARLDGALLEVIGSGAIGTADGGYDRAEFQQPQGMALDGETLYVADTENHLLRKIDLRAREVKTIAGTGSQRRETPPLEGSDSPLKTALNSPWALYVHKGDLYIAMAGSHQIWKMKLDGSSIGVYAGNGREDIVDGPLLPRRPYEAGFASFAQPSGLASDGTWLYVADSEGSSIRAAPLDPRGRVRTVVGTADLPEARLFTFGDRDGRGQEVRLQHALGVVFYRKLLYVADTYNSKVKTIDPADGTTRTLAPAEVPGGDGPPGFNEPAGITAAAGRLYVADTNNHRIRVIELGERPNERPKLSTLKIRGLKPVGHAK